MQLNQKVTKKKKEILICIYYPSGPLGKTITLIMHKYDNPLTKCPWAEGEQNFDAVGKFVCDFRRIMVSNEQIDWWL